jgi:putative zinc finger protein
MNTHSVSAHDETWLLLPWLANGRLAGTQRAQVEEHVRVCAACAQELLAQRQLGALLTEPERVTYAPGPSLRKLLERIDGHAPLPARAARAPVRGPAPPARLAAAWRPPGLAWAATFLLTAALGVLTGTAYHWSRPAYATYTAARPAGDVLHVAFDRSLPFGEVEELLRSAGARVVEGPGTTGVFGIVPSDNAAPRTEGGAVSPQMRALAARLRGDARVRWIEPLSPAAPAVNDVQGSPSRDQ